MPSNQDGKSHCGDKTILWSSYLHNGISHTGELASLYWTGTLVHWSSLGVQHVWLHLKVDELLSTFLSLCAVSPPDQQLQLNVISGGRFKNTYELLNQRALKFSYVNKIHIFQCMGKIFCVEFQRYPLKFHTKYLTHTLKDMIFMQFWNFKSS